MNLQETKSMLEVLQAAFPTFYRGMTNEELLRIIKLWQMMFEKETCSDVMNAVYALISTKIDNFPPTIGAVKEQIVKIKQPQQMSEMEAWSLVNKACRNGSYAATEEFNKLPETVQRAIGSADQLRVWAQMDEETVNSVVASNFMRAYKTKQAQKKEMDMLPNEVKNYMGAVAEKMKLESKEEKKAVGTGLKPLSLEAPKDMQYVKPPEDLVQKREVYQVPSDNDWEKMREAALKSLTSGKKVQLVAR